MTNTTPDDHVWQTHQVAQGFLDNVRSAIPLATVQIECLLRLIQQHNTEVKTFLDLGCGDGILGRAIAKTYPTAQGIGLDFSEAMLNAAKNHPQNPNNLQFIQADFGQENWQKQSLNNQKFDVIVSGFAIHHQSDNRKKELYQEIYHCLNNGGIFLNLEHVASHSPLGEKCFDEIFVDSLYQFHQQKNTTQNRAEIKEKYYSRADKIANILAPVESQCQWLREMGYNHVDCYLKIFEIALFGGCKL
jgi:ubiquinone/menaquinone biosynthesis C-methylase UbiE